MISCDEEASHCATDLLSASLPAIKLKEQPAKDANLFHFSGSVASCQDASTRFSRVHFLFYFCVNVGFATLTHLWLQKSQFSASDCTEGQALTLKWAMHHDGSLCFNVMPSCCLHSLQLSRCFCKQSITNPVCQCTNIFLNTWKPRSYKSYASLNRKKPNEPGLAVQFFFVR